MLRIWWLFVSLLAAPAPVADLTTARPVASVQAEVQDRLTPEHSLCASCCRHSHKGICF